MPARSARPESILTKHRSTVGGGHTPGTHVMYPAGDPPIEAQGWDGWPLGWDTPLFGTFAGDPEMWLQRVSLVMTCVDLNSRQLGSMPIYGVSSQTRRRATLPSWATNPEPNVYASWSEFCRQAVNSLQLHGEIVLVVTARFANGYPARFVAVNPSTVTIDADGRGGGVVSIGGAQLDGDDVLVIKYQSLPMTLRGIGPLEWIGRNLVGAEALEHYATDIALHGVQALLKHPSNISPKQADDLRESWMRSRALNGAAPAIVPGGIEYEQLQLSPRDMALLDLRIFDEQRIAAAFGVPPFLVGLPQAEGLTYANATALFDFHWRATLRPMSTLIAEALSQWALPRGQRIEFDRDEYVRPDLEGRARAYESMHRIEDSDGRRAITVDEIRIEERMQPYVGDAPLSTPPAAEGIGEIR